MLQLIRDESGRLALQCTNREGETLSVACDFLSSSALYRNVHSASPQQVFAKALGLKRGWRRVLDTTAGFGEDAAAMAYLGFKVWALEKDPMVFAVLEDGWKRWKAEQTPENAPKGDLRVSQADSVEFLKSANCASWEPQVIYLDPLYFLPKRKAKPNKKMQILHELHPPDLRESEELLEAALATSACRVVVKRAPKAPHLMTAPSFCYSSKNVRFDIYENHKAPGSQLPIT